MITVITDIIETVNEIIAELKDIMPTEELPEAMEMSIDELEMDEGLDTETKAASLSAYLEALVDAVSPSNAEAASNNDIQQRTQHKRSEESIDNSCAAHEKTLSSLRLTRLKELAKEQGLDIRGRSKAVYINALVGKYRLALLNS